MILTIVTPYTGAASATEKWARAQEEIDFRRDLDAACRCTVSFAATELKRCLGRLLPGARISYASEPGGDACVELAVADVGSESCDYRLTPTARGVRIAGEGRVGALYGAYEFLKLQGFRWYFPDERGEYAPDPRESPVWPSEETRFSPDMDAGRGFDLERLTPEDDGLWLWMARNRLNIVRRNAAAEPVQRKLGMRFKEGGHIFEPILRPDCVLDDGRTVWEAHRDWYGKPSSGEVTPENALRTQFCVSNDELVAYLSEMLIRRLRGEWSYADRVDVWGFDTWGSTCRCENCRALGNDSDQMLHFLSRVREALNRAALGRRVELVMCAYEGTATLTPPERDIPQNLVEAGDLVVFYPITRCYRHAFDESPCWENERFHASLAGWLAKRPALKVVVGEYYNVSKFEDLPLLFTDRISGDFEEYVRMGVTGVTYMHFPISDLSLRALNHVLYAELSWDAGADAKALMAEYFLRVYGAQAVQAEKAYRLLEDAWRDCAQLRSWSGKSILSQLINWDGAKPNAPLGLCDGHFRSVSELIERCERGVATMKRAEALLSDVRETRLAAFGGGVHKAAVNPAELGIALKDDLTALRVAADLRAVRFGIDVMRLTLECVSYHDALYRGADGAEHLTRMREKYDTLESYTMGLTAHDHSFDCRDALTRSQLRATVLRCAQNRR